eukprot:TRINITY_DN2443_c0_g1_i3.p2 TRINITY_DN2443_c0_g1~~TRINITY_DN2443_c0_g1_i3.p2  ORF type:complete len:188 (-),score=61.60 TRINITY_DN2443_c0_g1_i3:441-1004(-)
MVDGAADEETVGELGDLDGEERVEMAVVAEGAVKGEAEEVTDGVRDVERGENVEEGDGRGNGVDEVGAGVVAGDVDVARGGIGGEAAGEGREEGESLGEGASEEGEEGVGGEERAAEQDALLDVLAGEHGKVGDGEFEIRERGFLVGMDGAFGDECGSERKQRRRHDDDFSLLLLRTISLSLSLTTP